MTLRSKVSIPDRLVEVVATVATNAIDEAVLDCDSERLPGTLSLVLFEIGTAHHGIAEELHNKAML